MSDNNKINTPTRWDIIHHMKNGHSTRETVEATSSSKSPVHHIWHEYEETGHVKDRRRSDRLKKIEEKDDREIIRAITRNPLQSLRKLTLNFNLSRNIENQVYQSSIKGLLKKNQLISRKLSFKMKVSDLICKKRLTWAKERIHWSLGQWDVVFSDESYVQNFNRVRRIRVKHGSDISPSHFIQKNKWDVKLRVWGLITGTGLRGFRFWKKILMESHTSKLCRADFWLVYQQ